MLEFIVPYIENKFARALPPYQTFLNQQRKYVIERWKRFYASAGYENAGIRLLRYILQFVDMEYLDTHINNYERYMHHIRFIRKDLMNTFDGHRRGKGFRKLFMAPNEFLTNEYLLPIEDINSIVNLPLETEDWHVWKRVRPLRLWTYDSNEYTICMINDRVRFFTLPPSYAVELLDVIALIFKYFIWYKHQRQYEPAEELALHIPQQLFLHKYVMCDWCWDLTNIWLISCFRTLLNMEQEIDLLNMKSQNLQTNRQYGWVSNDSYRGFYFLWQLMRDTSRSVRPEALLSSKVLLNGSLNDRMLLAANKLVLPIYRQYDYLRWLRDRDLVWLFLQIWIRQPNHPKTKRIFINFRREFLRLIKQRPWNVIQVPMLRDQVEREMDDLMSWCEAQRT